MFETADVTELLLFYESYDIRRKLQHTEITLHARNLLGPVRVYFTCYRADQEPKFHHLDREKQVVVFCKAVAYQSGPRDYHLHWADQTWQGNWIQFMRYKSVNDKVEFEIIEGASVYPPALKSRKHRRPFPLEENDEELVANLFFETDPM